MSYGRVLLFLLFLVVLAVPVVLFFVGFRFFWVEDILKLPPVWW